jgi:hypothetical protein
MLMFAASRLKMLVFLNWKTKASLLSQFHQVLLWLHVGFGQKKFGRAYLNQHTKRRISMKGDLRYAQQYY